MTDIKLKRGSGAPLAGDLAQGEPALDLTNKRLYTSTDGSDIVEVGTNPTKLAVDTDTLVVDAFNDRVGINVPSPTQTLDVKNTGAAYAPTARFTDNGEATNWARVDIKNNNATDNNGLLLYQDNNGAVAVRNDNFDGSAKPMAFIAGSTTAGYFDWHNIASGAVVMRLDSSGNLLVDTDTLYVNATNDRVGINNSNPTSTLDINGSLTVDSGVLKVDPTNNTIITTAGNGDGKGITFNSSTYNSATTLDYYQEGFWLSEFADAQTGGNVATVTIKESYFTRIGNVVYCSLFAQSISPSGVTGSNPIYIRGLPFTVKDTVTGYGFLDGQTCAIGPLNFFNDNGGSPGSPTRARSVYLIGNTSVMQLMKTSDNGNTTAYTFNDIASNGVSSLNFNFFYFAAN